MSATKSKTRRHAADSDEPSPKRNLVKMKMVQLAQEKRRLEDDLVEANSAVEIIEDYNSKITLLFEGSKKTIESLESEVSHLKGQLSEVCSRSALEEDEEIDALLATIDKALAYRGDKKEGRKRAAERLRKLGHMSQFDFS